jgi:hypothetical protein
MSEGFDLVQSSEQFLTSVAQRGAQHAEAR